MGIFDFSFAYVVFPGLVFATVVALFFEGIDRKVAAHLQNRIGPPVWQAFLDVGKLFSKEDITPRAAQSLVFMFAPLLALGSIVTVMLLLPVNSAQPSLTLVADPIVIIYLLNIPAICMMMGGYSSAPPFGAVGSGRYVVQLFGYELAFILAALTVAIHVGSLGLAPIVSYQAQHGWLVFQLPLAAIAALLVAPAKLLRVPFDIPEAETEIVHGAMTEYSGPKLAIFRIAYNIEVLAVAGLIAVLFFGGPVAHTIAGVYIPGVVSFLIKCLAIVLMITVIRCIAARLRIDQALKFYWAVVAPLALINMVLVMVI